MDNTTALLMERVQRAALLILFQSLNTAISAQNTLWSSRDSTFYAALSRTNPSISAESVANENFYVGHNPSLILAPKERYPNCSVFCYIATPIPTDDDWGERYRLTMGVELMVKSHNSEEEVNARIQRTVEAAHSVFMSDDNRRLPEGSGGAKTAWQLSTTPLVTLGDVFVRQEEVAPESGVYGANDLAENRWFWQGGRLQYDVERYIDY